jgi:flagellar hook-basal body complex protein FliE
MDVKSATAAAAYAAGQVKGAAATNAASNSAAEASGQGTFSEVVKSAVNNAVDASHNGESVAMQALVNPGDLGQVVNAVTNAEVTMQTMIAVRDRVVQAYQDILRMPI